MNTKDIALEIANSVLPFRKRTERMVGFVPYTLNIEMRRYQGVAQKPEKITILEKTIVRLIDKGVIDINNLAGILGLDTSDDIENVMLTNTIDSLRNRLQLIKGGNNKLSLTPEGIKLVQDGVVIKSFSRPFELYIDPLHVDFPLLKKCLKDVGSKGYKKEKLKDNLLLTQIRHLAQYQASYLEFPDNGLELLSADLLGVANSQISFFICFVQSIRDNSVRSIIYDNITKQVIPELSSLFDSDTKLRDDLLKQCLTNEVENDDATRVESGEKSAEQIETEKQIIEDAEANGETIPDDYKNEYKVGKIYDSAEFEQELQDIFNLHKNQEIWLISPWIRKYAFLRNREPKIRSFLDQGGTVFIGYSEPEKLGEEMVDVKSMEVIKDLDECYNRFYFAELPKFHFKNVIEFKNNKTKLFTGSFNVLSFCINDSTEHYRMEQMMLADEESAIKKRQEYLLLFTKKYIIDYYVQLDQMSKGSTLKVPKLKYLEVFEDYDACFEVLKEEADKKSIIIDTNSITELNRKDMISLANKVITICDNNKDDSPDYVKARLSALLYLYEETANKQSNSNNKLHIEELLFTFLLQKSIYSFCKILLNKGRKDQKNSIIRIICNDVYYEFGEFVIPSNVFKILYKHKEYIDLKGANIPNAKHKIKQILYNSATKIGAL